MQLPTQDIYLVKKYKEIFKILYFSRGLIGNRVKYKKICDLVLFSKKNIKKSYIFQYSQKFLHHPLIQISLKSPRKIQDSCYIFPRNLQYLFLYVHVLFNPHFRTFHAFAKQKCQAAGFRRQMLSSGARRGGIIRTHQRDTHD